MGDFFDKVADFFKEKKMDSKFKDAGEGRSVAGTTARDAEVARERQKALEEQRQREESRGQRQAPQETSKAAQAAIERLESKNKPAPRPVRSLSNTATHPPQTTREAEARPASRGKAPENSAAEAEAQSEAAVSVDFGATSALSPSDALQMCFAAVRNGSNPAASRQCEDTLALYLTNIVANPGEQKYRRIRMSNKQFAERVGCVQGGVDFLIAAGFTVRVDKANDGTDDRFLVLPDAPSSDPSLGEGVAALGGVSEVDVLVGYALQLLQTAHPSPYVPERRARVFTVKDASPAVRHFAVPAAFYDLSVEEARKELKLRKETAEKELTLRTKAMREQDAAPKNARHYRFALVRVRFPDSCVLEGTFHADESFGAVRAFVAASLAEAHKARAFALALPGCTKPQEDDGVTLRRLGIVPAALVNLLWRDEGVASGPAICAALMDAATPMTDQPQ